MFSTVFSFLIVLLCGFAAGNTIYKNCGTSKLAKLVTVDVEGCDKNPCILKKGKSVHVNVTFTPEEEVTAAKSKVYGIIDGLPVPFPLDNPDGCKNSGLTCPLKKGVQDKFLSVIPVKKLYPSMRLLVKWEMEDQNKKQLWCFVIPVKIES